MPQIIRSQVCFCNEIWKRRHINRGEAITAPLRSWSETSSATGRLQGLARSSRPIFPVCDGRICMNAFPHSLQRLWSRQFTYSERKWPDLTRRMPFSPQWKPEALPQYGSCGTAQDRARSAAYTRAERAPVMQAVSCPPLRMGSISLSVFAKTSENETILKLFQS